MNRWYRAYVGTVSDDKLSEVAMVAECSRSVAIATWHAILESAAVDEAKGSFSTTPRRVAATLQERCETVERVFAAMTELEMVADGAICAWAKRQFESDNSTKRSRAFRERHGKPDATLQGRDATPPDTETEPDTEKKEDLSLASLARAPDDAGAEIVGLYERLKAEKQATKAKRSVSVEFIQSIVGRWNKLASDWRLPQVMDITETRQRAIIARSKDLTGTYEFPDPVAGYDALFAKVRSSPFLRGEKGFRVDFDFVVRQSTFTKIMEGKYEADTLKRFS